MMKWLCKRCETYQKRLQDCLHFVASGAIQDLVLSLPSPQTFKNILKISFTIQDRHMGQDINVKMMFSSVSHGSRPELLRISMSRPVAGQLGEFLNEFMIQEERENIRLLTYFKQSTNPISNLHSLCIARGSLYIISNVPCPI